MLAVALLMDESVVGMRDAYVDVVTEGIARGQSIVDFDGHWSEGRVNCRFAVETGPEKATTLRAFLDSLGCKGMGVNLDPANLVMVAGDDPVAAVHTLAPYIVHTHAKDGVMVAYHDPEIIYDFFAEGGIGDLRLDDCFREVPLDQGSVPWDKYLAALRDIQYDGYLTIERETGDDPAADIQLAVNFLRHKLA